MSVLVALASRVADSCLVHARKINRHTLIHIVVVPVAVTAALNADARVASTTRHRRQDFDRLGDLVRVLRLEDAPRTHALRTKGPKAGKSLAIVAIRA